MKYVIQTIQHAAQRYNTPADYTTDEGVTTISVSALDDEDSEMGVALHEFIESYLCRKDGITEAEIDAWDMSFNERLDACQYAEPGNHPDAPYHNQHMFALEMERRFIEHTGTDWNEHDARVMDVCA